MTSAVAGQKFNMGSLSLDNGTTSTVTIEGMVGGKVVDTWTGLIQNQSAYVNVTLNWTGIDELFFSSGHQSNVFVTNIDTAVANVPEPATVALIGLGLLGVAASRRKKQ